MGQVAEDVNMPDPRYKPKTEDIKAPVANELVRPEEVPPTADVTTQKTNP